MPHVTVTVPDGSFSAYLATPAEAKRPGILVCQEIFGVNAVMRNLCDELAKNGYVALCPDLFWRQEPGIDITDQTDAEWARAFELFQGFDVDKGIDDLKASLALLRARPECTGAAGTIGYCLGGKLAYLMATRSDTDCSVAYYGVGLDELVGEAGAIRRPVLMHMAGKDQFVPPEAQEKIKTGLTGHPQVRIEFYPEMDHAFCRVGGAHYDKANADLANERTAAFLKSQLG